MLQCIHIFNTVYVSIYDLISFFKKDCSEEVARLPKGLVNGPKSR